MNAVVLLYYREPYSNGTRLVCACDDFTTAHKRIEELSKDEPDIYKFKNRFELLTVQLVTKEDVH